MGLTNIRWIIARDDYAAIHFPILSLELVQNTSTSLPVVGIKRISLVVTGHILRVPKAADFRSSPLIMDRGAFASRMGSVSLQPDRLFKV